MPSIKYENVFVDGVLTSVAVNARRQLQATVVDVADNSTTISAVPAMLYGVYVNTVLSAHALPITNAATARITLPASTAAGTQFNYVNGVPFETSLIVDPNDAATGNITVVWSLL